MRHRGASIIGTPRGALAAANRLRLGDLGVRINALREGRYEAAARLDNGTGLPNELVVILLGTTTLAHGGLECGFSRFKATIFERLLVRLT